MFKLITNFYVHKLIFQARRAFQALKGIIRLQALVRGHLVRRQAVVTLLCLQSIIKLQAAFHGQRVRASDLGKAIQQKLGGRKIMVINECRLTSLLHVLVCVSIFFTRHPFQNDYCSNSLILTVIYYIRLPKFLVPRRIDQLGQTGYFPMHLLRRYM